MLTPKQQEKIDLIRELVRLRDEIDKRIKTILSHKASDYPRARSKADREAKNLPWHKYHKSCIKCHKTDSRYEAKGLCNSCYKKVQRLINPNAQRGVSELNR